jgi:acyl carrier protein
LEKDYLAPGKMNRSSTVRDFIVQNFLFGDGAALREETSFLGESIIDSTGILELVFFLEERFGIKVEDDELVPENMDNLRNIAAYLDRKLNGEETERA